MKNFFTCLILLSGFVFTNCQDDHDSEPIIAACGVPDPANNIPWLQDLISKAEDDRINKTYNGAYIGTIQLDHYRGTEVFIINMAFIGGRMAVIYDCNGVEVDFSNDSDAFMSLVTVSNLEEATVIYSTRR